MFDDLIKHRIPPPNRVRTCQGSSEQHLTEGAVMLAFALHLLRTVPNLKQAAIHPDGEHGKQFEFRDWLEKQGYMLATPMGSTSYGGVYRSKHGRSVVVQPKSGLGDVFAEIDGKSFIAECKGGVINTKHPGQVSRLRQGLCETIGLSLASELLEDRKQFVVVPKTVTTEKLAMKLATRARLARIEIALVDGRGNVFDIR